ncbi:unnamed protein product [Amoebophrya sp. A25]|nr:unnamed protein product [Amoebophrya sp. A25]|eukprot:GSA25T00008348001.1
MSIISTFARSSLLSQLDFHSNFASWAPLPCFSTLIIRILHLFDITSTSTKKLYVYYFTTNKWPHLSIPVHPTFFCVDFLILSHSHQSKVTMSSQAGVSWRNPKNSADPTKNINAGAGFESDCGVFSAAWLRSRTAQNYDQNLDPDEQARIVKREAFLQSIRTHINFLDQDLREQQNRARKNGEGENEAAFAGSPMTVAAIHARNLWNQRASFEQQQGSQPPTYHFADVGGLPTEFIAQLMAYEPDGTTTTTASSASDGGGREERQSQQEAPRRQRPVQIEPSLMLQGGAFGPDVNASALRDYLRDATFYPSLLCLELNRLKAVTGFYPLAMELRSKDTFRNLKCLSVRENRISSLAGLIDNTAFAQLEALDVGRNLLESLWKPACGSDGSALTVVEAWQDLQAGSGSSNWAAASGHSASAGILAPPCCALRNLRVLNLRENRLGPSLSAALNMLLPDSLLHLDLSENCITEGSLDQFFGAPAPSSPVVPPGATSTMATVGEHTNMTMNPAAPPKGLDLQHVNIPVQGQEQDEAQEPGSFFCSQLLSATCIRSLELLDFTHNGFKEKQRHYRRRCVAGFPGLRMLDGAPIGLMERECAEAWIRGGAEAEARARKDVTKRANKVVANWSKQNTVPPRLIAAAADKDNRSMPKTTSGVPHHLLAQQVGAEGTGGKRKSDRNSLNKNGGIYMTDKEIMLTLDIDGNPLPMSGVGGALHRNTSGACDLNGDAGIDHCARWAMPGEQCRFCQCKHPPWKPQPMPMLEETNQNGSTADKNTTSPTTTTGTSPQEMKSNTIIAQSPVKKHENTGTSGFEHVEEFTVGWRVMPEFLRNSSSQAETKKIQSQRYSAAYGGGRNAGAAVQENQEGNATVEAQPAARAPSNQATNQSQPPTASQTTRPPKKPVVSSQQLELAKKRERMAEQNMRDAHAKGMRNVQTIAGPDWAVLPSLKIQAAPVVCKVTLLLAAFATSKDASKNFAADDAESICRDLGRPGGGIVPLSQQEEGRLRSHDLPRKLAKLNVGQLMLDVRLMKLLGGIAVGGSLEENPDTTAPLGILYTWLERLCSGADELLVARENMAKLKGSMQ